MQLPTVRNPMRAIWAICAAPPPSCLRWALGAAPYPCVVRAGPQRGTPHASSQATPAPKPHQFPAELAQEAVKPSAVHARAGAPARPASSSSNSSGSRAEKASGPASGAPALRLAPRLLALGTSGRRRRRRPNIWQPCPAPGAAAKGGGAGLKRPRLSGQDEWVGEPDTRSPLLCSSGGRGGAVAESRAGPAWDSPTSWAVRCMTQDKATPRGSLSFPVFPGIGLRSPPQELLERSDPPPSHAHVRTELPQPSDLALL